MSISPKGTKMMSTEFSNMKVVDLKRELRLRGLSTSGVKEDLIERLNTYTARKLIGSSSGMDVLAESMIDSEILDEDDVLKSDLEEADEEEVLEKMESESSKFSDPLSSPITEAKIDAIVGENPKPEPAPTTTPKPTPVKKKIVLVRKASVPILGDYDKEKEEKSENEKENGDESKVIKLTGYTEQERKEMRAKKFGVVNDDDKKAARAARFGLTAQTASVAGNVSLETLKKRAERFGEVVSPLLTKTMLQEQMEARKRRFNDAGVTSDVEEKKRLRAERFKVSA